jgi:glycosyltransferase involved in cell wall biosynthesis
VHAAVHESLGLALLEAMYLGKPVVATRAEGPSRIVVDCKTGFLVDTGDADTLAERMLALLRRPEAAEELGAAGRRRVLECFPPDAMARSFVDVLSQVASVDHRRVGVRG